MKTKYLWIAVEADEYELPIAVAETARELGEMLGTTKHNVEAFYSKGSSGRICGRRIIRIRNEVEANETDDTVRTRASRGG